MYAILLGALASLPLAYAANKDAPLLPKEITNASNQFITVNVENDLFGNGTDQNYTSGVSLTYFDMGLEPNPLWSTPIFQSSIRFVMFAVVLV